AERGPVGGRIQPGVVQSLKVALFERRRRETAVPEGAGLEAFETKRMTRAPSHTPDQPSTEMGQAQHQAQDLRKVWIHSSEEGKGPDPVDPALTPLILKRERVLTPLILPGPVPVAGPAAEPRGSMLIRLERV